MLISSESAQMRGEPAFVKSFSFIVLSILASGSIILGYVDGIRHHNMPELIVVTFVLVAASVIVALCLRPVLGAAPQATRPQQGIIMSLLLVIALAGLFRDLIHVFRR